MSDDDDNSTTRLADVAMRKIANDQVHDGVISEDEAMALEERLRRNTAARKEQEAVKRTLKGVLSALLKSWWMWIITLLSSGTYFSDNIMKAIGQ